MQFTSPMLRVNQLSDLFQRANEMVEIDLSEYSEHKNATVIDQLNWASEEVIENCKHPNTINTLDGEICEDCGKENND